MDQQKIADLDVEAGGDSSAPTLPSVVKEPELVTIIEDKPLTNEQLEQEHDLHDSYESSCYGPGEHTPLLRSGEVEANRSTDFLSFTTSQASLFIPSVQFSLYSSRGHEGHATSPSILSSSRRGSLAGKDSRIQSVNSVHSTKDVL
ncbi:hypothetical protein AC249_AIPGENE25224 [Exaiptasia diaphana]|nr:hypothetical protein AC249_AIPGENE25224 [Exaiptasia diaphana]